MELRKVLQEYIPFWNQLTSTEQLVLEQKVTKEKVKKGTILHNGEIDCLGLLIVVSGGLRAYTVSEEGKAITLYRLLEHDMCLFTASCIMSNVDFEIVIETREDSEVLVIPTPVYQKLMNTSLPVSKYTNELMASHFSDVMWVMEKILNKSFDARLAGFLIEETRISKTNILKMTHEEIANNLGTAREVVTRMLKYFQAEELVILSRGSIELIDKESLEKVAGNSLR